MEYKAYKIINDAKGQVRIVNEAGPLPETLSGIYTSVRMAEQDLLKYAVEDEAKVVTRGKKSELEAI